jgi:hypothetical protein
VKPTFDQIFKLTGTHLAAGALGFVISVLSARRARAGRDPHQ